MSCNTEFQNTLVSENTPQAEVSVAIHISFSHTTVNIAKKQTYAGTFLTRGKKAINLIVKSFPLRMEEKS